jgi:hypothetical protein
MLYIPIKHVTYVTMSNPLIYKLILRHRKRCPVSLCAQAVRSWLPTAAARVRARSGNVGFVMDKVALVQVFSEYFGFPCQSSFHQILHPHNHPGHVQEANW